MLGKRGLCPRCRAPIEVPDEAPEAYSGKQVGGPVEDAPVTPAANPPSSGVRDTRPCPACGESILRAAQKCRFCGEFLDGRRRSPTGGASGERPANHLVQAIFTALCCCVPFGIVSIVYATQVDSKWNQGDGEGARVASDKARFWSNLGIGLGLLAIAIQIVIGLAA